MIEKTSEERSPLQKKVDKLIKIIISISSVLVVLLFLIELLRKTPLIESLIIALTFGMSAIPEEFPLVFTLYLSLGAWRLSKHGVLVKSLTSVETLGTVDIICTDKTGTLTEGQFKLIEIVPFGSMNEKDRNTIALLSCEPTPVDSMEIAITEKLSNTNSHINDWQLIYDYPFENFGKHMTHIWVNPSGESILAMKGSAEGVLEHCKNDILEKSKILDTVNHLASQGKRILGLASKKGKFTGIREIDEQQIEFIGLLVFSDPIRSSVKKSIHDCQNVGIDIKMLTGDHLLTAKSIADELQISHSNQTLYSGSQLNEMSQEQRTQCFLTGKVFARVTAEQKYEMIQILKNNNKIVAMTGDGVNDSPALKLADIGISMGENATDVARSSAKIVLIKNNFDGIVQAIFEGRRIMQNLKRSFSYLISFHIPVMLLAFIPPLFGWPQILQPVHIILLELIVHPISAFAFENLKSKSTRNQKSIIPLHTAMTAVLSGVLLSILSVFPFIYGISPNSSFNEIRNFAFSTLLFGNIGLTLSEAWPNLNSKRILSISIILLSMPIAFNHFSFFSSFLKIQQITFFEILSALLLGILASIPTFIIRQK